MNISAEGIALIKKFEGLRLEAYKPVKTEKYYTIGYGHYGADVTKDMVITEAEADAYLKADLASAEKTVNAYVKTYDFNINQYSALVSFTFNLGAANFKKLINNGKRSIAEISAKIPAYNKAGGKVLEGLVKRRAAEKELFDKPVAIQTAAKVKAVTTAQEAQTSGYPYSVKVTAGALNVRKSASKNSAVVTTIKKDSVQLIDNASNGFGHLANNAGWIALAYTQKV